MRNLTKTLAVVSLLGSASAYPLGIGDIKLHSSLNQNLNAEIALVVAPGEDVSNIKVTLAPPAKFDEAGVAWSYFLSKIKFEPVVKPNGSVVIKVTSKEALKEPFLDFLVQVSWPKGNLYREFTVLVDPPAVYKEPSIPVQSVPEVEVSEPSYEVPEPIPTPEPQADTVTDSEPFAVDQYDSQAVAPEAFAEPEPEPGMQPSYQPQRRAAPQRTTVTTRRNDTLWKVADPYSRKRNVSVEQMAIAIYKKNPHAFYKKNINALSANKRITIPPRQTALKLSRSQALAEVRRQHRAWSNTPVPPKDTAIEQAAEQAEKQLKLVAPSEAEVGEHTVVTPGAEKTPSTEKNPAQVAEIQAIQNKVAELEKQLATMQQIIALKDQQLAALQNQNAGPAKVAPAEKVTPPPAEPVTAPEAGPRVEPPPVIETTPPAAAEPPVTPIEEKPVTPQPAKRPDVKPEPRLGPVTAKDYYYLTVGGLGAAALAMLGWLWWRKKKVEKETDADSMFASSSVIIVPDADEGEAPAAPKNKPFYNVDTLSESSFLSEFTTSDFDVFDTAHGDIDPISEADVYLAYGRYQQAEELMRQAIKDQPNDDECKLKLLEIFYANENKTAFEAYARELADAGKNFDVDFWAKVSDMGKDICPGSSLFGVGAAAAAAAINQMADDHRADLKKPEPEPVAAADPAPAEIAPDLAPAPAPASKPQGAYQIQYTSKSAPVMEKQTLEKLADAPKEELEEDLTNNDSIEFDLSVFAEPKKPDVPVASSDAIDEIESFEFSFDKDATSKPKFSTAEIDDPFNAEEFHIDKLEENAEDFHSFEAPPSKDRASDKDAAFDSDFDFDFNFDLDPPPFGGKDAGAKADADFDTVGLADMDELETKLDLARAYIDMGDNLAAKDIAQEVLEKGSAEQKRLAQLILDELA